MHKAVYVIYDKVAKVYSTNPFYMNNDNEAKRMFFQLQNDPSTPVYHNPGDFELYCIATYDNESAVFNQFENHELVLKGATITPINSKKEVA